MQRLRIATVVASSLLFFCAATAVAQRDTAISRASIRGSVLDDLTRAPVGAALVQILANNRALRGTTTDGNGRFILAAPPEGPYRLRVTRIGYLARDTAVTGAVSGAAPAFEIRISPSPMLLDSILVVGRADTRTLAPAEQLLHGRLLDDNSGDPIVSGTVQLLRANGSVAFTTISNQHGLFRLRAPMPGAYAVRAERIGYTTSQSGPLNVMLRDTLRLDFLLSPDAVVLNPLTVTASARPVGDRYKILGMDDYFRRMNRWKQSGYFINRDTLDWAVRRGVTTNYMINEMVLRSAHGCNGGTQIWVNGAPAVLGGSIDDAFPPSALEAVEVYVAQPIPAEFLSFPTAARQGTRLPCKVISLWSRQQPKR